MGICWTKTRGCEQEQKGSNHEEAQLGGGNVHIVTSMGIWEAKMSEAAKNKKIVVANFSASWCGPCRTIARTFSELSDKYTSIIFLTIDVDELAEFSSSWEITATPTFFFLRNGQQVDKLVGANKDELIKKTATIADHKNESQS